MKRFFALLLGLVAIVALTIPGIGSGRRDGRKVLAWDVMAAVTAPYTGATNPIGGVPGAGLPWEIDEARGHLGSDGNLKVEVEGLVLARRAPVPPALQGTNPVPTFKAVVSCQTIADGAPATAIVSTEPVPASAAGDAEIHASVSLPAPCFAPIVFVTSAGGAWFAVTGI